MNFDALLLGLGSTTLFTSRAFIPAFLTGMFLRFGDRLPYLSKLPMFENAGAAPTWFTHGATLTLLGILAALEVAAMKSPEAEEALEDVDKYLKAGVALLSFLGVLSVTDQAFISETVPLPEQAGVVGPVLALLVGGVVFYLAGLRQEFREFWIEADEDDDLGIRGLFSWLEDAWASFGVLLLFLYPLVMLLLMGLFLAGLTLLQKYFDYREEKAKVSCPACGNAMFPAAMECHQCGRPSDAPAEIGFFGQSKKTPAPDRDRHPLRLAEKRRCPRCAGRLKERHPVQACPTCKHEPFADPAFSGAYIARVTARLPKVLIAGAVLSLIPVLGIIPGVMLYRLTLAAPFRRYVPLGRRFMVKWLIRILFFVLIGMQLVPGVGGVVVPLMAAINYLFYRAGFQGLLPRTPPPVPAPAHA